MKSTRPTFANSPGWNERPPTRIHTRAPLTTVPVAYELAIVTASGAQRRDAEQVAVALQRAVVGEHGEQRDEAADADRQPDRLIARARRVEPVDLDDADGHEQPRRRQEHRIGVREGDAERDVGHAEESEERPRVGQRERRDDARARDEHGREADRDDGGDEQQQAELAIAARAQADGAHGSVCSSCATRERADSLERR